MSAVLAEAAGSHHLLRGHSDTAITVRRDVDGVRLTIKLAHEAGLAILDTGENRQAILPRTDYIGWTDLDACPAIRTAVRDDKLDHDTASN
jgi:hypothetical protein